MSNFTIYCSLKELLVPCFAAADQGIGFNDSIFFSVPARFCGSIYT